MCRENRRFASEAELESFCTPFLASDMSAAAIARRLREVGAVTQATGDWAPPPYLRTFLAELEQRHTLASPGVVRGWVEKLVDLGTRFEAAIGIWRSGASNGSASLMEHFEEITDTLASIANAVGGNCDRIGKEVSRYRAEEDTAQIRVRLSRLVDLHAHYLEPVLGLVDIGGSFHAVCERISANCVSLAQDTTDEFDQALRQAAVTASRDVVWLRRGTLRRAHEANRELGPLCEAAARESTIARGVNRALGAIASGEWDQLALGENLQVVIDQDGPLFSDRAAKVVLTGARNHREEPPPLLGGCEPSDMTVPLGAGALREKLEAHEQLSDVLEWICDLVGRDAADGPAGLLYDLIEMDQEGFTAGEESRLYAFSNVDIDAHVWAWKAPSHD